MYTNIKLLHYTSATNIDSYTNFPSIFKNKKCLLGKNVFDQQILLTIIKIKTYNKYSHLIISCGKSLKERILPLEIAKTDNPIYLLVENEINIILLYIKVYTL